MSGNRVRQARAASNRAVSGAPRPRPITRISGGSVAPMVPLPLQDRICVRVPLAAKDRARMLMTCCTPPVSRSSTQKATGFVCSASGCVGAGERRVKGDNPTISSC